MNMKTGFFSIEARMKAIVELLDTVDHHTIQQIAKHFKCSESTIQNALNNMLRAELVTRRRETIDEVNLRAKRNRQRSYAGTTRFRAAWLYSSMKRSKNVQLTLIPVELDLTLIPDESGLTEHP